MERFVGEREKAKQYALRLLSCRAYSSERLRLKMLQKGYSEEIVDFWIEWLKRVDLLKDDLLLSSLIEKELKRGYGPKAIPWKLRGKGFSLEEITRAMAKSVSMTRQKEAICAWAKKKGGDARKLAFDLIRRGFDADLVRDGLREFH